MFPNSEIKDVTYYGEAAGPREAGTVLTVDFVLDGQEDTGGRRQAAGVLGMKRFGSAAPQASIDGAGEIPVPPPGREVRCAGAGPPSGMRPVLLRPAVLSRRGPGGTAPDSGDPPRHPNRAAWPDSLPKTGGRPELR